nr:hypothetical protein [Mesorhizobium sediminum]
MDRLTEREGAAVDGADLGREREHMVRPARRRAQRGAFGRREARRIVEHQQSVHRGAEVEQDVGAGGADQADGLAPEADVVGGQARCRIADMDVGDRRAQLRRLGDRRSDGFRAHRQVRVELGRIGPSTVDADGQDDRARHAALPRTAVTAASAACCMNSASCSSAMKE